MTTEPDTAALPHPEWGACGFDKWHEPHEYVIADGDQPVTLPCPGIPGDRPTVSSTDRAFLAAGHRPGEDIIGRFCTRCLGDWPCDTNRALALLPDPERLARALHVAAIEAEAREDVQGRLDLLIHVCQDIVRDAGTAKWPVNLDRLRMALDELGALEEEG